MEARKSGINDGQFDDKMSAKIVSRAYLCLGLIRNGVITQKELARQTGSTIREIRYVLEILHKNGYTTIKNPRSNKWKKYNITQAGDVFLGSLRSGDTAKYKHKNEKTRYKFEIHNQKNIRIMINSTLYLFKKNDAMKNIDQYDAEIDGHWVQVTLGNKKSSLVITAPQYKTDSFAESSWFAIDGILQLHNKLDKKWELELSVPVQIDGHGAKHTKFADAIMRITGGKQVRLGNYWINQSPPNFIPEEEGSDLGELERIIKTHVELPIRFENIEATLEKLNNDLISEHGERESINYNMEKLVGVADNLSLTMMKIMDIQKDQGSNIGKLTTSVTTIAENLTNLMNMVNPNLADKQVTIGDNSKTQKTDVLSNMFG